MNGWLIAGIVIGVIAVIAIIIRMLYFLFCMLTEFETRDREYMSVSMDKYVKSGYASFFFSVILGMTIGIYNCFNIYGVAPFWERTREHNIAFIGIFVALLLLSIVNSYLTYDDKTLSKRKIRQSIYYAFIGVIGGAMVSIIVVIIIIITLIQVGLPSGGSQVVEIERFRLEDGTLVEGVKGSDNFMAIDGSCRIFERTSSMSMREVYRDDIELDINGSN